MNGRLLTLTGPVFAVLFVAAIFLIDDDGPGGNASGREVVDYANDHQGELLVGVFAGPALAALIVLFFSQLRTLARDAGAATGAGPSVMVAGAVLWAGALLVSASLELAVVDAGDNGQTGPAETLNVVLNASWVPFIAGIGVTLIGAGMTVLRVGLVPRWLGWVALVGGVISLAGPGGFLGYFLGPLWMLVVGVMLLRGEEPAPATV